jgi:hypothetical protein
MPSAANNSGIEFSIRSAFWWMKSFIAFTGIAGVPARTEREARTVVTQTVSLRYTLSVIYAASHYEVSTTRGSGWVDRRV